MIQQKLKCIIIDDDPEAHAVINRIMKDSHLGEIKYNFYKCSDFLNKVHFLDFDLCFIDCFFPNDRIQGVDLALKLKELNKHFIFISANHRAFIEACSLIGALDAIPKPNTEQRVKESLERAYSIIFNSTIQIKKENELCYVAEHKGKISVPIPNILYGRTDDIDPRNKLIKLKNNVSYTLMDYKFSEILKLSQKFVLVNRSEIINYEIVEEVKGDSIYLKQSENIELPKTVTLSKTCKKYFNLHFQ